MNFEPESILVDCLHFTTSFCLISKAPPPFNFFSYANAKIISGEEDVVVFYNCQLYFSSARRKSVSSGYLLPCFFVPRWPKGLQIIREIVRLQWKLQKRRANGHGSHSITINQDLLINKVHFLFSMIQGIIKRTLSLSF